MEQGRISRNNSPRNSVEVRNEGGIKQQQGETREVVTAEGFGQVVEGWVKKSKELLERNVDKNDGGMKELPKGVYKDLEGDLGKVQELLKKPEVAAQYGKNVKALEGVMGELEAVRNNPKLGYGEKIEAAADVLFEDEAFAGVVENMVYDFRPATYVQEGTNNVTSIEYKELWQEGDFNKLKEWQEDWTRYFWKDNADGEGRHYSKEPRKVSGWKYNRDIKGDKVTTTSIKALGQIDGEAQEKARMFVIEDFYSLNVEEGDEGEMVKKLNQFKEVYAKFSEITNKKGGMKNVAWVGLWNKELIGIKIRSLERMLEVKEGMEKVKEAIKGLKGNVGIGEVPNVKERQERELVEVVVHNPEDKKEVGKGKKGRTLEDKLEGFWKKIWGKAEAGGKAGVGPIKAGVEVMDRNKPEVIKEALKFLKKQWKMGLRSLWATVKELLDYMVEGGKGMKLGPFVIPILALVGPFMVFGDIGPLKLTLIILGSPILLAIGVVLFGVTLGGMAGIVALMAVPGVLMAVNPLSWLGLMVVASSRGQVQRRKERLAMEEGDRVMAMILEAEVKALAKRMGKEAAIGQGLQEMEEGERYDQLDD